MPDEKTHKDFDKEALFAIMSETETLANVGGWAWDISQDLWTFSDNWLRIHGCTERHLSTSDLLKVAHPDDIPDIQEAFDAAINKGLNYEIEHRIIRQDTGEERYIRACGRSQLDDDGKAIKIYGSAQDITEHRHVVNALRESEQTMRYIIKHDPNALAVYDRNLCYIAVSDRYVNDYDVQDKNIIGKHHYEVFPEMPQRWKEVHQRVLHGSVERNDDDWFKRSDGSITYNRWECRPWYTMDGSIGGMITYTEVTTERKLAEKALQDRQAELQQVFEALPDALVYADVNRRVVRVNPAFTRIFGYKPEEVIGRKTEIIYASSNDFEEQGRQRYNLQARNVFSPYEITYRRKNGETFLSETVGTPVRDTKDNVIGLLGLVRDISEKNRLQEQLKQAQKLEAIGTLSGGIAHDFNNILSIILGNTELALSDVPEWSPARNNLKEVRKACDRAKDVIQQILSFSRKAESEMRPVNIAPIIKETLKLLRASIPTSIEIRPNIAAEMATIKGDPTQVHQVLLNLCTNAAHAMEEEGGVLGIELTDRVLNENEASQYADFGPGRYVKLTVKDAGQGMTPDVLDRIFDPYFTTKETGKGTGMGLAVVLGIVKSHGGAISVTSTPGEGTRVEVLFPAVDEPVTAELPQVSESLPHGHERILFVDDEAALVRLNEQRLTHLGYQVETQTDPLEALERFRSQPDHFDLVITDTTMPHMTGDRLAREIMRIRPDIPVLLCTGYSDRVDKERARDMGIAGFAMKPIDMGELAKTVCELLDNPKN